MVEEVPQHILLMEMAGLLLTLRMSGFGQITKLIKLMSKLS